MKAALVGLQGEPQPAGCLKLTAREGWRLRVGSYRLLYEIDDKAQTVTLLDIRDRNGIYR